MDKNSILVAALILPCAALAVALAYFTRTLAETNAVASVIIDCIELVVSTIIGIYFVRKARKTIDTYQDILRDAFRNDKRSRKKLREAYRLYSKGGQHNPVMKQLDKLESACADNADYAAVSMLRALCCGEMGKTDEATRYCEAVEQYGFTIPDAAKDAIFHPKTLSFKRKTGC